MHTVTRIMTTRSDPVSGSRRGGNAGGGPVALAVTAVVVVALALLSAGGAWACVPQPLITLTPMASGPPGTEVTVNGYAINGQAEVRWNALDGPLLADALGPVFSVPIVVPEAEEGLYGLIVLERADDGSLGSTARAAFEVTAEPSSPAPVDTTTTPESPTTGAASSGASVPAGLAAAGAVGLLALGGAGGAALARRRPPA